MATIRKRRNRYCVIYRCEDENGKEQQKWETFATNEEAKRRKKEIEAQEFVGTIVVPSAKTLNELMEEYMSVYGVNSWAMSTYESKRSLYLNYIAPMLGSMQIKDISTHVLDKYYQSLLRVRSKATNHRKPQNEYLTAHTVREIHKLLRSCFNQAVKWDLLQRNPCDRATLPKEEHAKREIWDMKTLQQALSLCDDDILRLAMNLAFSCSLRIGEMLALTWDCVEISDTAIQNGEAFIFVNKELQRVNRDALSALNKRDVVFQFPAIIGKTTTALVLKKPKTETSTRKVFLPETVAKMLIERKATVDEEKSLFGDEYNDYNLVFCSPIGRPMESQVITHMLKDLIEKHDLPPVVFHSLRHSSITYKLKLSGGDIKMAQGDSGHAQATMVTEQYAHVLDDDRRKNAQRLEQAFYQKKETFTPSLPNTEQPTTPESTEDRLSIIMKLLSDPQTTELLKVLVNKV